MKRKNRNIVIISFIMMVFITLIVLFPFYWMFITAVKPVNEVFTFPPKLWPSKFIFSNFVNSLQAEDFGRYYLNSAIVTFFATVITVSINLLAGFAFAKYEFRGKRLCFLIVLSTLMIPMQVTMIPNFIIASKLGIRNSYIGLILPPCAEGLGLFLSRQFVEDIPNDLIEAARIDGATEFNIFCRIIIPNVKPLISVLVIFTVMWRWNDLQWPLIMTSQGEYFTVQMGLSMLNASLHVNWNHLMSACLISTVPVLIIFFIFQKHFVQGISSTGIKG